METISLLQKEETKSEGPGATSGIQYAAAYAPTLNVPLYNY